MVLNLGRPIFTPSTEALASYDYVDIADGTGVVVFHGGAQKTSSGAFKYELSRAGFYSDQIASGGVKTGTGDAKLLDIDFDIKFINSKTIDGKAIINVPISVSGNVATSTYVTYVTCAIQKVVGGTETELFALTSGSPLISSQSYQHKYSTIIADLPQTHFKTGETLRLQTQLFSRGNGSDVAYSMMGMDPKNRSQSGELSGGVLSWVEGDSDLQLHVPFKLEI